jgi:hypothetical protein
MRDFKEGDFVQTSATSDIFYKIISVKYYEDLLAENEVVLLRLDNYMTINIPLFAFNTTSWRPVTQEQKEFLSLLFS